MANIFDYLEWRCDVPLAVDPFNEVDNLVLAELVYTVDIWSDSPARNQAVSEVIDRRMAAARLRRDYLADLFDTRTGHHHRSLRYRAVADEQGNI